VDVQIPDADSSYVHERTSIAREGGAFRPAIRKRVTQVKTDWEAVYRSVYPEVLRFLRWMVWDDERARDLAQEAFVRVLGKEADNPRGLVFKTASNLARDEARMVVRRKRHLSLLRVEEDVRAEEEASPAAELEARERAERLRRALAELSETDREVLLLWNAGFDYAEIAAQTGLARGAIGTTVARAKKKLVSAHDALESTDAALG
jgi:RNA polymerase sigma factor (sigma-70 family)